MADDLGDEWWLDTDKTGGQDIEIDATPGTLQEHKKTSSLTKANKELNKRKHPPTTAETKNGEKSKKAKKKRKKNNLSSHLASRGDQPGTKDDLQVSMATYFHEKLSTIEMEELILDDDCFLQLNSDGAPVSEYLSRRIPTWTDMVDEHKKEKTPNHSCIVLLLTSSAKRAVDLNRDTQAFKGTCVTAKLFAKHLRISEQVKYLESHRVQFAVATPHRVSSLLESGSFNVDDMKYVILDWNWRDAKLRRFVDIPELRKDLFDLLRKHLVPAANKGQLRFGLF
ncbi:uncharacterized protein C3orf26 homolog [Lytechinus variegatus]|uniref:uncharacterized protein C3orf26 homolog n=1 Tax=Lytechinus variegatus TaxID=7654 RepID=UPI001BB20452|nr:uncharacterized protein C3orf26 homolog [Lytechinus variegatus]XP_041475225.1 uncharacterized protein C3orf26 homolog [Lytechinus variegatus]